VTQLKTEDVAIPDATDEPAAYVAALLEVLGDQDPVAVLEQTPAAVDAIISEADPEQLDRSPRPDTEWSSRDVLAHLLDVDIVYGFRIRLALTAEVPTYPGYDEKAFSSLPKLDVARLADGFRSLRAANMAIIRSLTPELLARRGVHGEQGPEDVGLMVRKLAGHDLAHLAQMRRAAGVSTPPAPHAAGAERLLRAAENAFAAQDLDAICELFTDDVVARYAGQPELRGKAQLRDYLASRLSRQDGYAPKKLLLTAGRDLLVDSWTGTWIDRDTGRSMAGRGIEVLRLRNGKVSELDAAFVTWSALNETGG
jgi:ketosteroid isomerase-like protein